MKNCLFLILVFVSFQACYDNFDIPTNTSIKTEQPQLQIDTKTIGGVYKQDGSLLEEYQLAFSDYSFDIKASSFELDLEFISKYHQHIDIIKDDIILGFASIPLVEFDINKINLSCFPIPQKTSISLNNIEEISLDNDHTLHIVEEKFKELNISNLDLEYRNLASENLWQQTSALAKDDNFDPLILYPNLCFQITSSLLNTNDNSELISLHFPKNESDNFGLFHYNKVKGYWTLTSKIELDATQAMIPTNGYYKLANYSPSQFVEGDIKLLSKAVAYQSMSIREENNREQKLLSTADGSWITIASADSNIELTFNHDCPLANETYNFTSSEVKQQIEIPSNLSESYLNTNFSILDCDGELIKNPSIYVQNDNNGDFLTFNQGDVDSYIPYCSDNVNIASFDTESSQTVGLEFNWSNEIQDNIGVLSNCNDYEKGFNYININGELKLFDQFSLYFDGERTYLISEDNTIKLVFKGKEMGAYSEQDVNLFIDDPNFGTEGYQINCLNSELGCGISDFYISHYEQSENGVLRASFSGNIWVLITGTQEAANRNIEGQILINF